MATCTCPEQGSGSHLLVAAGAPVNLMQGMGHPYLDPAPWLGREPEGALVLGPRITKTAPAFLGISSPSGLVQQLLVSLVY